MKSFLHILIVLSAAATVATAGSWWERVSDVSISRSARLEAHNGILMLHDGNQVLRSNNNGASWQDMSKVFPRGVYAFRHVGHYVFAFAISNTKNTVDVLRSDNEGVGWSKISSFPISTGNRLEDVTMLRNGIYAITNGRTIQVSWDLGLTWNERTVKKHVGVLVDFAACNDVWMASGTKGAMWSADAGLSWYPSVAPQEIGSGITHIETHAGTIWAGGQLGAARFDLGSRSWHAVNKGIPEFASLLGRPMVIRNVDGVLFGVFKTFNGVTTVLRASRTGDRWIKMESAGLPPHNEAGRHNFAVMGNKVFLYYHGSDVGFVGLYQGTSDAPTSVEEDVFGQSISIGPNPASDHLRVTASNSDRMTITIVDVTGRPVISTDAFSEATLNIGHLPMGTYQIRVSNGKGTTTRPIVVQR